MAGLPRDRDPHQRPARGAGLPCPGLEKDTGDRSSLLLRPKQLAHNTQCRKRCATLQQYQDIFHLNSKTTTTTSATPSLMPEIKTCSKNRKWRKSSTARGRSQQQQQQQQQQLQLRYHQHNSRNDNSCRKRSRGEVFALFDVHGAGCFDFEHGRLACS